MSNEEIFNETLRLVDTSYLVNFYQKILLYEPRFFERTVMSSNMFEKVIEICKFFNRNLKIIYHVVHLVDKFYDAHLSIASKEYTELCDQDPDYSKENSWKQVLLRIKHQIPLRVTTCIFVVLKYLLRATPSSEWMLFDFHKRSIHILTRTTSILIIQSSLFHSFRLPHCTPK